MRRAVHLLDAPSPFLAPGAPLVRHTATRWEGDLAGTMFAGIAPYRQGKPGDAGGDEAVNAPYGRIHGAGTCARGWKLASHATTPTTNGLAMNSHNGALTTTTCHPVG